MTHFTVKWHKSYMSNSGNVADNNNNDRPNKKDQTVCFLCNKSGHVQTKGPYGMKLIQYFTCLVKFASLSPAQRLNELKTKGLCVQCLFPGAKANSGKHVEGKCQSTYVCKHNSHQASVIKKHVLVCEEHKGDEANKTLLEEYRSRCITRPNNSDLSEFSKTIQLTFHVTVHSANHDAPPKIEEIEATPNTPEISNPAMMEEEVKDSGTCFRTLW